MEYLRERKEKQLKTFNMSKELLNELKRYCETSKVYASSVMEEALNIYLKTKKNN